MNRISDQLGSTTCRDLLSIGLPDYDDQVDFLFLVNMNSATENLLKSALTDVSLTPSERRVLLAIYRGEWDEALDATIRGTAALTGGSPSTDNKPAAAPEALARKSESPPQAEATRPLAPSRYRLPDDRARVICCDPPINMTVLKAAAYLRVGQRKIRYLIADRKLKHARIGAKIIVRREYLDDFLAARSPVNDP